MINKVNSGEDSFGKSPKQRGLWPRDPPPHRKWPCPMPWLVSRPVVQVRWLRR
jgi:hypothetical protein